RELANHGREPKDRVLVDVRPGHADDVQEVHHRQRQVIDGHGGSPYLSAWSRAAKAAGEMSAGLLSRYSCQLRRRTDPPDTSMKPLSVVKRPPRSKNSSSGSYGSSPPSGRTPASRTAAQCIAARQTTAAAGQPTSVRISSSRRMRKSSATVTPGAAYSAMS